MADDPVDKFLTDEKSLEAQRQDLIKDILRQKDAAIKAFDEKLARLGHHDGPQRRSHHKTDTPKAPATKTKL